MIKLSIKVQRSTLILMHWFRDDYPRRVDGPASVWYFGDGNKKCWRGYSTYLPKNVN